MAYHTLQDNGKALPSFVSQLTELEDKSALSSEMIDTIKWAASSAYLGSYYFVRYTGDKSLTRIRVCCRWNRDGQ